jgi:hypothetical protein
VAGVFGFAEIGGVAVFGVGRRAAARLGRRERVDRVERLETRAAAADRASRPVHGRADPRLKGSRRLKTIHPEQPQIALDWQLDSVYGYSFILTDIYRQHAAWVEHFHRHRVDGHVGDLGRAAELGAEPVREPGVDRKVLPSLGRTRRASGDQLDDRLQVRVEQLLAGRDPGRARCRGVDDLELGTGAGVRIW